MAWRCRGVALFSADEFEVLGDDEGSRESLVFRYGPMISVQMVVAVVRKESGGVSLC
jgi:hypothetical protein